MPRLAASLLGLLATVSTLCAQGRTWVVDAANGPGTDFTNLPPAVAAAAAGDRILVRAGGYTGIRPFRPLTIVGEPNAVIRDGGATYAGLNVSGIPAGTTFSVSGLTISVVNPLDGALSCINCAGTVIFDNVQATPLSRFGSCADLRISGCSLGRVVVEQSAASFDRCVLRGGPASFFTADPAVQVYASVATFSRCDIRGSDQFQIVPNSAAVRGSNATLVITGDGSGTVRAGIGSQVLSAVDGTGTLVIDPRVQVLPAGSAPPIAPSLTTTTRPVPSLKADGAPPGGTVRAELFANQGDTFFLLVGLPSLPVPIPSLFGHLWLRDPVVYSSGTIGASGITTALVPVPNVPLLEGLSFAWQGLAGTFASGFAVSNPATYTHSF